MKPNLVLKMHRNSKIQDNLENLGLGCQVSMLVLLVYTQQKESKQLFSLMKTFVTPFFGSPTCQSILSPIKYKHEKLQFQNFSKLFQNSRTLYI